MSSTSIQQKEKTAQFIWTGFILLFFFVQAVVWVVAISITSGDSSHAVVAGYDEQALKWDENKLQQQTSDALGWQVDINVDADADVKGNRKVTLSIFDNTLQPIEGAFVNVRSFHCGHAANVQKLQFDEFSPGQYAATLRILHGGNWQFEGPVLHHGNTYLVKQRLFVAAKRKR